MLLILSRLLLLLTLLSPALRAQCSLRLRVIDLNEAIVSTDLAIQSINGESFEILSSIEDKVISLPCDGYYLTRAFRGSIYPVKVGPVYLKNGETLDFLLPISYVSTSHTKPKQLHFERVAIPGSKATILIRYEAKLSTSLDNHYSGKELQASVGRFVFTGGTIHCNLETSCQVIGISRITVGMKTVGFGTATIGAEGIVLKTLEKTMSFSLREANAVP